MIEIRIQPNGVIFMLIFDPNEYIESGKIISPLYNHLIEEIKKDGIEIEELYFGICG